jgi:hypothetical protein
VTAAAAAFFWAGGFFFLTHGLGELETIATSGLVMMRWWLHLVAQNRSFGTCGRRFALKATLFFIMSAFGE